MIGPALILLLAVLIAPVYFQRQYVRHRARIAADPGSWPKDMPVDKIIKYTNLYLEMAGWQLMPPWDWCDVWIRASRDNLTLSICVVDNTVLSLPTIIQDTTFLSDRVGSVVGVLTNHLIDAESRNSAKSFGIFVINASDLPEVGEQLKTANLRRQRIRQGTSAAASVQ